MLHVDRTFTGITAYFIAPNVGKNRHNFQTIRYEYYSPYNWF